MSVEDNKNVLRNFVKAVLDGKNLNAADRYLAPNFFHHDLAPGEQTGNRTGREGQKNFFKQTVFPAFSGFETSFQDMIGFLDLVAGRWVQSVQQTGPWLGRPPSNKKATIGGISIVRVRSKMIVEEWEGRDTAGLLTALGVMRPLPPLNGAPLTAKSWKQVPIATPTLTAKPLPPAGWAIAPSWPTARPELERTKAISAKLITDVLNDGNLGAVDQILSTTFVDHDRLNGQKNGKEGIKQFVDQFKAAFPDSTVTPDVSVAEGDRVALRWTVMGTHQGSFLGIPATQKKISCTGIYMLRIAQDRITEKWGYWPIAETVQQLTSQV